MFMTKLKIAAIMVLTTIGVLGIGVVGLVGPGQDIVQEAQAAAPQPAAAPVLAVTNVNTFYNNLARNWWTTVSWSAKNLNQRVYYNVEAVDAAGKFIVAPNTQGILVLLGGVNQPAKDGTLSGSRLYYKDVDPRFNLPNGTYWLIIREAYPTFQGGYLKSVTYGPTVAVSNPFVVQWP